MALGWREQYYRYKELFLNVAAVYKRRADVRMFLEIILSLSTVTIFLLFALRPTLITIIDLVKQIDERQKTVTILDKKIKDLNTARNVYSQQTAAAELVASAVPTSPDVQVLVSQVQGMAGKNSVNLLGFSIGELTIIGGDQKKKASGDVKPIPGGSKEIPVTVSISGSYENINSFIIDLENFRRPILIDTLGINSSETAQGKSIVAIIAGRFPYLGVEK